MERYIRPLGLGLLFGLVLVWQIPNVVVLRFILLAVLSVLFGPGAVKGIARSLSQTGSQPTSVLPFYVYGLFLIWLLIVALGIAAEPFRSLAELKGQWLPPTLCLLIGFGAARQQVSDTRKRGDAAVRVVFWALVAHAVLQLIVAAWTIYLHGNLPAGNFGGISDHKANVTYTNVLALGLLLTEMAFGTVEARLLGLGRWVQAITFVILLLSTYVSATRNGIIVFLLLTAIGAIGFGLRYKRYAPRRWSILAAFVVVMILGAWAALKSDSRWERFAATVPVAWDIDGNHAWVDTQKYPVPLAIDGKPVDVSAYERVAFAHAALRFLSQNPLGTEVSRDAFKSLVSANYATTLVGHPHNSYLDLGISVGLPGLAIWLAFLSTLIWFGWKSFRRWKNPAGIALVMVVLGFALRSLLDSIVRDHIIQEFMLTCALLIGCIEAYRADKVPIASR